MHRKHKGETKITYYYRCNAVGNPMTAGRKCSAKYLNADRLERQVWEDCRSFVLDPGAALEEARARLELQPAAPVVVEADTFLLLRTLEEKKREKERILTLYRQGVISDADVEAQLEQVARGAGCLSAMIESAHGEHAATTMSLMWPHAQAHCAGRMDHASMSDTSGSSAHPGTIAFIQYGKANVSFYRTYARPLTGLTPIPESAFVGRPNTLFAYDAEIQVLDQTLAPAYTEGDNSQVVATDTMKNFIHQVAIEFEGATLEEYLLFLGKRFFETWDHVHSLRLLGRELPFPAAIVPTADGFGPSGVLFGEQRSDFASASLEVVRDGAGARITAHRAGREGLHLIKVTGSAFADFVRDQYTTLPAVKDRPLYIYLDAFWRYADAADAVSPDHAQYVAAEQVRDLIATVFHEFVSMSIQHLMHEMGQRILARYPQLSEVSFDGQNRLWDTVVISEADPKIKSYCDPRPPYGSLHLTLKRG